MAQSTVVRARIDVRTKNEAAAVLAAMGLTVSDAFRLLMVRGAREKALPFEPLKPNAATIRAMKKARKGKLKGFDRIEDLMADLKSEGLSGRKRSSATTSSVTTFLYGLR